MDGEFESVIRWAAAICGIAAAAIAFLRVWRQREQPSAREYGRGAGLLTRRSYLLVLTILYFGTVLFLWQPLPILLSAGVGLALDVIGAVIFFPSILLYLLGMRALGAMFGPSSALGARLYAGHRLITSGPYRVIRNPMYAGVICAGIGGLLIYRTWGMLFFASTMFGLIARARVEEKVLLQEFGRKWVEYRQKVPAWIPKIGRRTQ